MRNNLFLTFFAATCLTVSTFAAVGPQSIRVTFNGSDSEGWSVSSNGSITSVADGAANVQMAKQNNDKYRADFQNEVAGTFTIDKTRDIVWAIKLTAPLPGSANSRKFEFQYKDANNTDKWVNGINNPSGQLECAGGGCIYYFNLGADGLNKLEDVQDGAVSVNKVHFIMADAVVDDAAEAHYSVDWIATFSSVNDLKAFQDWNDEAQEDTPSLPYLELLFRPKSDGTEYDDHRNGFVDNEMEGNWNARMMVVEYFLIEDYSVEKIYTLALTKTNNNDNLAVWDFPYQVNYETSASDINTMATAVVGYAPGTTGTSTTAIASVSCTNNVWSFTLPAYKLTPLATIGSKTLVGVLITTALHDGTDKKGKFASACHASTAHPSLTLSGTNPVVNVTRGTAAAALSDAVSAASNGDVLELRGDVTISGSRLEIKKELTIQGATGSEKIICGVNANTIMLLINGSDAHNCVLKDLVIDGQNTLRSTQTVEAAGDAAVYLDNVRFVNTAYSVITGDVKSNSSKEIYLKGNNTIPNGIYLNRDKRVNNQYATHTTENPILIYLVHDYQENYAIVRLCNDPSLYNIVDAAGTHDWKIYVATSGSEKELKGTKIPALTFADDANNATALTTYNGQTVNATISRTITADGTSYATFCVPFDIDAETVAEQLGNPELLRYHHADVVGDVATFYFTEETAVEAGVPYLIKPEAGAELNLVFKGVTVDNAINTEADANYQFIPVYSPTTIANATEAAAHSVVYLSSGNQLKWAAADASLKGLRAYFKAVSAPAAAAKRMVIGRGMTTSLDKVQNDEGHSTKLLRDGQVVVIRNGVEYNALGQRM